MDNTIYDCNTENTLGFYTDLKNGYKELIQKAIERDDYEDADDMLEQLQEIEEYKDYEGLLVLSMNNGMGFTVRPYRETTKIVCEDCQAEYTESEIEKLNWHCKCGHKIGD